jgi:hypothetical protein
VVGTPAEPCVTASAPGVVVPSPQLIVAVKFQLEDEVAYLGSLNVTPLRAKAEPGLIVWPGPTDTVGATSATWIVV